MLFAEKHRKLGRHGSRIHDRSEDLLTSTTIQLLRYIPLNEGLLSILARARTATSSGGLSGSPEWMPQTATRAEYECWKRIGRSEPDVVVTLFDGLHRLGRIVIEIKLDSAKSSEDSDGLEENTPLDQLAKYWIGLQDSQFKALGVVYLTSQSSPPVDEIASSLRSVAGDWLAWLSWGDVWAAVRRSPHLAARDLADILEAKQLSFFRGFAPELSLLKLGEPIFGGWK